MDRLETRPNELLRPEPCIRFPACGQLPIDWSAVMRFQVKLVDAINMLRRPWRSRSICPAGGQNSLCSHEWTRWPRGPACRRTNACTGISRLSSRSRNGWRHADGTWWCTVSTWLRRLISGHLQQPEHAGPCVAVVRPVSELGRCLVSATVQCQCLAVHWTLLSVPSSSARLARCHPAMG